MGQARVVVIGGGATGTGIFRDLSMRGIAAVLVEKADLASGTSSRFHGLLHSGARYAVNDPEAACECIRENTILRHIGTSCVEETEGWFVLTKEDDPAFVKPWLAACRECGIETQELSVAEALRREPNIAPDALAVYTVPDAAVDGFRLVWHNAMSARRYGGRLLTYASVAAVNATNGRVHSVTVLHTQTGQVETIPCDFVINATGSWAGEVASLAGLSVPVSPDRGTLLAFNHRFTNRVVNRLRKAADGDIFVPHGSITIFGTTSVPTDRPDDTTPRSEEVIELLRTGKALFPRIDAYRMLRAFAGTRPLYTPDASSGRSATRNFVIIDHEADGLHGMVTVTGGKFTSYRLMAEKTVDFVAARLGVTALCRTAEEKIVPEPDAKLHTRAKKLFSSEGMSLAISRLGDDLERAVSISEKDSWKKLLLCECELVTLAEFETVASDATSHSLGDIRRRTRLGMGTCQGSFCALRATGALVENGLLSATSPQALFRQFLQERWNGIRPLLWGSQLREIELERGIYSATLNIDAMPGDMPAQSSFSAPPLTGKRLETFRTGGNRAQASIGARRAAGTSDVVVAGAGFAGLIAAAAAAEKGAHVSLVSQGAGALTIAGGTVDLLGFADGKPISGSPFTAMQALASDHPYSLVGEGTIRESLGFLGSLATEAGLSLLAAGSEACGNAWLPTAAGTMKPTWVTGSGMNPERIAAAGSFVVLGVTGMKDFSARLAAAGLQEWPQFIGKTVTHAQIAAPFGDGKGAVRDTTALDLAYFLDTERGVQWLAGELTSLPDRAEVVLLPSILGTTPGSSLHGRLESMTGRKLVELFCPPPSVTGLRMHHMLMRYLRQRNVTFVENATISHAITEGRRCKALVTTLPDGERRYEAESFVIATGGLFSRGIAVAPGVVQEAIFGLPLPGDPVQDTWSNAQFFGLGSHAFARLGVAVNKRLMPVGSGRETLFDNVFFAGRILGGYDFALEKSGSGVALATGFHAGKLAADTAFTPVSERSAA